MYRFKLCSGWMSLYFLGMFLCSSFALRVYAQGVKISEDPLTDEVNPSAILELSAKTKGLLLPRLEDTSKVQNPVLGLVIYQNADNKIYYYNGASWFPISAGKRALNVAVTLDKPILNVSVGSKQTVTLTVEPDDAKNKTITWTTGSDPTVASLSKVDEQHVEVTGLTPGTTKFVAIGPDGWKKATLLVTVTQPVTGLSLSTASVNLQKDRTTLVRVRTLPFNADNKAVTWGTSSNATVARLMVVDDSTVAVTGYAGGMASFTVTSVDGAKTATLNVDVAGTSVASTLQEVFVVSGTNVNMTSPLQHGTTVTRGSFDNLTSWSGQGTPDPYAEQASTNVQPEHGYKLTDGAQDGVLLDYAFSSEVTFRELKIVLPPNAQLVDVDKVKGIRLYFLFSDGTLVKQNFFPGSPAANLTFSTTRSNVVGVRLVVDKTASGVGGFNYILMKVEE